MRLTKFFLPKNLHERKKSPPRGRARGGEGVAYIMRVSRKEAEKVRLMLSFKDDAKHRKERREALQQRGNCRRVMK